jgi:5-methylcytosine-specific restriction endonuclease McrA
VGKSPAWNALNAKYIDGFTLCGYGCGRVAVEGDHIIPVARGGQDTEDNYLPSCRTCNARKGTGPPPRPPYYSDTLMKIRERRDHDKSSEY